MPRLLECAVVYISWAGVSRMGSGCRGRGAAQETTEDPNRRAGRLLPHERRERPLSTGSATIRCLLRGHSPKTKMPKRVPFTGLRKSVRKEFPKFGLGSSV